MIEIDGSYGEGGGQVLRSALTLALLTGRGVLIRRIRAGRKKPGLMAQHLKAVEAAAAVGMARVEGAERGATSLSFVPTGLHCGTYRWDIGTAGSTSLVLQTVLLPLSLATGPSQCVITGGTHVSWSPCYHYLAHHWLPYLNSMGFSVRLKLDGAGFYPRGGGSISAAIAPAVVLTPLSLVRRGTLLRVRCLSAVTNLPPSIARRQLDQVVRRLQGRFPDMDQEVISMPGVGKGTLVMLNVEFEHSSCCFYSLGARGKPAERVADVAVDDLEQFLCGKGAVDEHLADQMVLPLVFASGRSRLSTTRITEHLLTNLWVVRKFLDVKIIIEGEMGQPGTVEIDGLGWPLQK